VRAENIAEAMKQRLKESKSIEVWLESAEEILQSRQATQGRWLKSQRGKLHKKTGKQECQEHNLETG